MLFQLPLRLLPYRNYPSIFPPSQSLVCFHPLFAWINKCVSIKELGEREQPVRQKPIIFFFCQQHQADACERFLLFCAASTYGHITQKLLHFYLTPAPNTFLISICCHNLLDEWQIYRHGEWTQREVSLHSPLCTSMVTSLPLGHLLSRSTTWLWDMLCTFLLFTSTMMSPSLRPRQRG